MRLRQVIFVLAVLSLNLHPAAAQAHTVPTADAPPAGVATSSVAVVPLAGRHRGVQLRAQTVDVTITQDATDAWAETRLWAQLRNPTDQAVPLTVALVNAEAERGALPDDLTATVGETQATLTPISDAADAPIIAYTLPITVPARGLSDLTVRYRSLLPAASDLVTFTRGLSRAAIWSGRVESLRVTIGFAQPLDADQLLGYAPPASRLGRGEFTWHWEAVEPETTIQMAFLTAGWWQAFTAARAAAGAADAGLQAHLALADRYTHLARLPDLPFAAGAALFDRFYPAAVAALQVGLAAQDATALPADASQGYRRLAELYSWQAERQPVAHVEPYVQLAAQALAQAVALTPDDAALAAAAAEAYADLAQRAVAAGDQAGAERYRLHVEMLRSGASPAQTADLARLAELERAVALLAGGDPEAGRALLARVAGAEVLARPDARQPLISQAHVTAQITPERRALTMRLQPAVGQQAAIAALLQDASRALAAVPLAPGLTSALATTDGMTWLTLSLVGADAAAQAAQQAAWAAALPSAAEFSLLAAALRPAQLGWTQTVGVFRAENRYVERADLAAAWLRGDAEARHFEHPAAQPAPDAAGADPITHALAERLREAQSLVWQADADAWRSLTASSRVRYDVGETPSARWELAAGAAETISLRQADWRVGSLLALAGSLIAFLLLGLLGLWRWWPGSPRGRSAGRTAVG